MILGVGLSGSPTNVLSPLLLLLYPLLAELESPMNTAGKSKMISLRLTEEQFRWLENTTQFIENETGCKVTRASVVLRLMEKGLPEFQTDIDRLRAESNAKNKRFPKLHVAY
jgi:hypothetical protein